MNKLITLVALLFITAGVKSQQAFYKNYEFPDSVAKPILSPEELKTYKGIVLNDLRAKELIINPKGELESYYFYSTTILLNDESVIEKFNKIYIPVYNPANLILFKCRVTTNGKSVENYKGDMKMVNEDGDDYYILALQGIEKNSIIEYYYLKRIEVGYTSTEYINNNYYIKKYTNQTISPEDIVYASKSYNGMPDAKKETKESKNFLEFSLTNVIPPGDEKYCTNKAHLMRAEVKVDYNKQNESKKLNTYSDVAKRFIVNYHDYASDDTKLINKVYKKLDIDDKKTVDEKIFTIESHLKNEIGLMKNAGDYTMSQCYEKKGLTTFYRNKLIVGLLEKAGIAYEIVSTSNKNNQPFDPDFESYAYLDETFFYIPETKKYLMSDDIISRYGPVPARFADQKGLFVKPIKLGEVFSSVHSIKHIASSGADNYSNLDMSISFKGADNAVSMFVTNTMNGEPAKEYRALCHYSEDDKRTELINEVLKGSFKNAKVSLSKAANYDLKAFDKFDKPLTLTGLVETTELSEMAGQNIILKIGNVIGQQSELYQEGKRNYRIYTGYPHKYKRTITFTVPQGYTAEGLDKLNIKSELKDGDGVSAQFVSTYRKEGDKIYVEIAEDYLKEFYDIKDFDAFRGVINAAADFNKVSILLKKI